MKSPFPGMDPYLERRWLDLQTNLIVLTCRHLQRRFGDDFVARINERIIVEDTVGYSRRIGPDVRVVEMGPRRASGGGVALAEETEPVLLNEMSEPITERFIEIVDITTGGRVITIIEFVSPSNKLPGNGLKQYMQKQEECFNAKVNLVEIDLTRCGERTLLAHRWATARQHESPFQISIWRAAWSSDVRLYPIALRHRLPTIPIPLRPTDPEPSLDLQPLLEECHTDARYDRTTDYAKPCIPPLEGDEAKWTDELLKTAGKR